MRHLLLLLALSQPAVAAEHNGFWSPDGPPAEFQLARAPLTMASFPVTHGPDNSSGSDVPAGGFKYKKKKKQTLFISKLKIITF